MEKNAAFVELFDDAAVDADPPLLVFHLKNAVINNTINIKAMNNFILH